MKSKFVLRSKRPQSLPTDNFNSRVVNAEVRPSVLPRGRPDSIEFRPDEGSRPRIVLSYRLRRQRSRHRFKLNALTVGLVPF
jgi:hypothetical protein